MNPKETYNICDSLPEVVQKNKTNVVDLYDIIGNFTGTFVMGKYYNKRDIVVYNGSQYYCIAEGFTASKTPDVDDKNWVLYLLKGEKGDIGATGAKGDPGTTDVDTLYNSLTGSNGVEVTKNTAGDKVEVKLSNSGFTIGDTAGTVNDHTITINPNDETLGAYISVNYHGSVGTEITPYDIKIKDPSGDVAYGLTSRNVKTIFGQSIYGSGKITLYRHTVTITVTGGTIIFSEISSKNLQIDSLTNLKTVFGDSFNFGARGNVRGALVDSVTSGGCNYWVLNVVDNTWSRSYSSWTTESGQGSGLTFTDDVKTV